MNILVIWNVVTKLQIGNGFDLAHGLPTKYGDFYNDLEKGWQKQMKLLIEDWSQKNLTENAVDLMEEAVMCYKVGAYRSAYLMSYLAFKTTIRPLTNDF